MQSVNWEEVFCRNLKRIRDGKGLSKKELAGPVYTRAEMITSYENGKHSPRVSTISILADALGVSPAEFFALNEVQNGA